MPREVAFQGTRFVFDDVDLTASQMIVGQLHAVIKIIGSPADVKNVNEPSVRARDGFECRHAFELPQKRTLRFKRATVHNFNRAKCAGHRPRQPNLTVSAAPDHAQQFVIGNNWYLSRNLFGNGRFYTSSRNEAILGSSRSATFLFNRFDFSFQ